MSNEEHDAINMESGSKSESGDQNPSSPILVVSATVEWRRKIAKEKDELKRSVSRSEFRLHKQPRPRE